MQNLTFGSSFDQDILSGSLPFNLKSLVFCYRNYYKKTLKPSTLPKNLTHLEFGCYKNKFYPRTLPSKLTSFIVGTFYNNEFEPNTFPPSLTLLNLGRGNIHPIYKNTLPNSLIELVISSNFKLNTESLPISLKKLTLNGQFNQLIPPYTLPDCLTHLIFGFDYQTDVEPDILPSKLIHLELSARKYSTNHPFRKVTLPASLQYLIIGSKNIYPFSATYFLQN